MATFTLNADAPQGESVHFSFGADEFDLGAGDNHTSEDPVVIANAQSHPWIDVEIDVPKDAGVDPAYDATDPHDNPAADHLSRQAAEVAVEAADHNNEIIQQENLGDTQRQPDSPTTADAVRQTLETAAPDAVEAGAQAQVPDVEPAGLSTDTTSAAQADASTTKTEDGS